MRTDPVRADRPSVPGIVLVRFAWFCLGFAIHFRGPDFLRDLSVFLPFFGGGFVRVRADSPVRADRLGIVP